MAIEQVDVMEVSDVVQLRAARSARSWHVDSAAWMTSWGNRGQTHMAEGT